MRRNSLQFIAVKKRLFLYLYGISQLRVKIAFTMMLLKRFFKHCIRAFTFTYTYIFRSEHAKIHVPPWPSVKITNRLFKYFNATWNLYKLIHEPENNTVPPEGFAYIKNKSIPLLTRTKSARGTCNPMKCLEFSKPVR